MKDAVQAAWRWTTEKTKAAANATVAGTCKVAALTSERAGPAARAVARKSGDAVSVAAGTATLNTSILPTLKFIGFGSLGPIKGSYAAFLMSSMYGGATPAGADSSCFRLDLSQILNELLAAESLHLDTHCWLCRRRIRDSTVHRYEMRRGLDRHRCIFRCCCCCILWLERHAIL